MPMDIALLKLAGALASHSAARQGLIAENLANADTPGYRARDLQDFTEFLSGAKTQAGHMRANRPEHFGAGTKDMPYQIEETSQFGAESPNGNTVSLDDQMMRSAQVKIDHDLALGIYSKSLQILRLGLGRR